MSNAINKSAVQRFSFGRVEGVLLNGELHILKASSTRYRLNGQTYACLDGCCDAGIQEDVDQVALEAFIAKLKGEATLEKIILRNGQNRYHRSEIFNTPVSDVSHHVGIAEEGWEVTAC